MIRYLIDSSALWRIIRDDRLRATWSEVIATGSLGSCEPQRAEFRRSARDACEYGQMSDMFEDLYPDLPVPKSAWRWIEAAQHRLVHTGTHRALSVPDLLIAATAAQHRVVLLHDDNDFVATAQQLNDLAERNVYDSPPSG